MDFEPGQWLNKAHAYIRLPRKRLAVHVEPKASSNEFHRPNDRCDIPVNLECLAEVDASETVDFDLPARNKPLGRASRIAKVSASDPKDLSERIAVVRAADIEANEIAKPLLAGLFGGLAFLAAWNAD